MIRVLLVDDRRMVRETLKVSLESQTDIEIVETASNGISAPDANLLRRMENIALQVTGVARVYSSQVAIRPETSENILNSGR